MNMSVIDDAIEAKNEQGQIVARVFCAQCPTGKGEVLASVRRSSRGLVYDATLPGAVHHGSGSDEMLRHRINAARQAGTRAPFVGAAGACIVLLEVADPDQDPPEAECPKHGRERIAAADLIQAVRHRVSSSPAVVLIHHQTDGVR